MVCKSTQIHKNRKYSFVGKIAPKRIGSFAFRTKNTIFAAKNQTYMKRLFTSLSLLLLAFATSSMAQVSLTIDKEVRMGKLRNGMTYYIRHNAKEANLADFYIAQRVGSILEEPRQRGLAHFLEHMAFNGTQNFPGKNGKLGIVPWCETIGVKFGTNLNAYTSVEQTVYHIDSAPISRESIVDSCLLVLHDWSHCLLLEDQEIDKERGVIHEEWRTRRAGKAIQRMMEDVLPTIYAGTKYADCLPIGSMDIVDNFPYQDLRDYYEKWYRPDLQAIVVVGDIDCAKTEKKIKQIFGDIPKPKQTAERIYYPVPNNEKMIVATQCDKEQPIVLANLYMKREVTPDQEKNTMDYLRKKYKDNLITIMLNSRLADLKQVADPPFMSATVRAGSFLVSRTKDAFSISISCKQDNILGGITTAVGVAEQVRQHGFNDTELQRAKQLLLARAERQYQERNDRRNSWYVNNCVNHFLNSEPLISSEQRYQIAKFLHEEVSLKEVNEAINSLITDQNQVCVVYGPDKEEVKIPNNSELEQAILTAQEKNYPSCEEEQLPDKLLEKEPLAGTITEERPYKHGFTELTLSNGMKVYVKPTTFQADEISIKLRGEGGTSRYDEEDIPNLQLINSSITEAGVGNMKADNLRKMLAGKTVKVTPSVGMKSQTINGSCSKKDIETMFQLGHLYFTQPRRDTTAYASYINRTRSFLTNRNASPKVDYNDSINAILYGHHPRIEPVCQETLDKANYDRILQIYKERFADASNFNAVIIGNVDMESLRPFICQYLASLPATYQNEQARKEVLPYFVKADNTHKFQKKMATPLASVSIYYGADVEFTPKNDLILDFLTRVLKIAYTDSIREEKGGTYGVGVSFYFESDDKPTATLRIAYNADPKRYEELNPLVYQQLNNIAEKGPSESSMQKIRTFLAKQYDQVAITNDYWSYVIWHELEDNADFDKDYKTLVKQVTPQEVKEMASKFLQSGYRVEVTMLSEEQETLNE